MHYLWGFVMLLMAVGAAFLCYDMCKDARKHDSLDAIDYFLIVIVGLCSVWFVGLALRAFFGK